MSGTSTSIKASTSLAPAVDACLGPSSCRDGPRHAALVSVLAIDADRLKTLLDQGLRLVLVDVRSPADYQKGHIPGARSLSLDEPAERFRELPQGGTLIVLYCDCPEAEISPAYQFPRFQGYRQVLVLDGGLAAWTARGYPIRR